MKERNFVVAARNNSSIGKEVYEYKRGPGEIRKSLIKTGPWKIKFNKQPHNFGFCGNFKSSHFQNDTRLLLILVSLFNLLSSNLLQKLINLNTEPSDFITHTCVSNDRALQSNVYL